MKRPKTPTNIWDTRQLPAYLTPQQYADLLGICPRTVQMMCKSGEIPAIRIGKKLWRIDKNKALGGAT